MHSDPSKEYKDVSKESTIENSGNILEPILGNNRAKLRKIND